MVSRARDYKRTTTSFDGVTLVWEQSRYVWEQDKQVDGTVNKRDHYHLRERDFLLRRMGSEAMIGYISGSSPYEVWGQLQSTRDRLSAETYGKLRGRLYKGSAALGVTLASWKQSREMIVDRYRQMSLQSDSFEQRARRVLHTTRVSKNKRVTKVQLSKLGSQYLEMVFGWQPLLTDIHAAVTTVVNTEPQTRRIAARASAYIEERSISGAGTKCEETLNGVCRCTRAALVEISNPNLWLRERAGLNNPAAVAWDLVPWSWVVNLFSNTGNLVSSVTDFAGLTFPSSSITHAADLTLRHHFWAPSNPGAGSSLGAWRQDRKYTEPGGLVRPPLVFRLPEVSWGLALIGASVFAQKFKRLDGLMSFVQHK